MDPLVQNGLKVVNNAIARLSWDGMNVGSLFIGSSLSVGVSDTTPILESEARLQILCSTLRELKSTRDATLSLLEVIEDRIHILQKECNPLTLRLRFSSLPDDIVQRIFEVGATPDTDGCSFSVLVSHVCRRFRDLAFRTPRMWNVIHDGQPINQITTFLYRSKAVGICVFVGESRRRTNIGTFMNIVTQHCQRWTTFGCCVEEDEEDVMQECLACPGLALPILASLSYTRIFFEDSPGLGLFSSWVKPRLSHFCGSDVTLQPSMLGENLTSCHLDFDGGDDEDRTWDFTGVLHALASTRTLSELTLNFDDIRGQNIVSGMPLTLIPSLDTLDISFRRCDTILLIRPLMLALRTPNVSRLLVRLVLRTDVHDNDQDMLLDSVLPGRKPYPKLSNLDLTGIDTNLYHYDLPVLLAKKIPSLVNLSLEGIIFSPYHSKPQKDYPVSWANVTVNLCDRLTDGHLDFIIDIVKQSGKWDDFRKLKISNCRGLSLSYLRDLKARIGDKLEYQLEYKL